MKTILSTALAAFVSLALFANPDNHSVIGTYGETTSVTLELNDDHTFTYTDESTGEMQSVKGEWVVDGNWVKLKAENSDVRFPNRWKIDDKYPCLRSEFHALQIIRLCYGDCSESDCEE